MAGYDSYKDGNGVTWTIAQGGANMLATVLDSANPKYDPPAEDFTQIIQTPGDGSQAEVIRVAFVKLREKVDGYAAAHTAQVALSVQAHADPGVPWWVWVAGVILLARRR